MVSSESVTLQEEGRMFDQIPHEGIVVIPICYGSSASGQNLSYASIETLRDAAVAAKSNLPDVRALICCAADLPESGMNFEDGEKWNMTELENSGLPNSVEVIMPRATNSITEAVNNRNALIGAGIKPEKIVIYCDIFHAMRLRYIYKRVFALMGIEIEFVTKKYVVGRDYIQYLLTIPAGWFCANFAGLVAMVFLGLERCVRFEQPD